MTRKFLRHLLSKTKLARKEEEEKEEEEEVGGTNRRNLETTLGRFMVHHTAGVPDHDLLDLKLSERFLSKTKALDFGSRRHLLPVSYSLRLLFEKRMHDKW